MTSLNFSSLIEVFDTDIYQQDDWLEWRYCYEGGRLFRQEFLKEYSDRETKQEYERRRSLTPIPSYARKEIKRVANALVQRIADVSHTGGSAKWREAIAGEGKGIDRRGRSMNAFLKKHVVSDLLVMGEVGVLVDAPRVNGKSAADVPKNFRPYLNPYPVERYRAYPAPVDMDSDWVAVIMKDVDNKFSLVDMASEESETFRVYWVDERTNIVQVQRFDKEGTDISPQQALGNRTEIPFVVYDIGESMMRDPASYQIALLNMISADSNYAIDSNYALLTRQRGNANAGAHLIGADDEQEIGSRKGIFYEKNMDRPGYIAPPSDPMRWSLELRRELKEEVRELVTTSVASLGEDGTLDAGLAAVGAAMAAGEARCWDHWAIYESTDATQRKPGKRVYPTDWSIKTDEERIEKATKLIELQNRLSGTKAKKRTTKMIYDELWVGKTTVKDLDEMKQEVDDAPFTTSDPEIVKMAGELHLAGPQTLSISLGYDSEEYKKAQEEQERRAEAQAKAQADVAQAGGSPGSVEGKQKDGQVDPSANKLAREGDVQDKQNKEPGSGVRGEGK